VWKGLPGTNALAYLASPSVTDKNRFTTLTTDRDGHPPRRVSHVVRQENDDRRVLQRVGGNKNLFGLDPVDQRGQRHGGQGRRGVGVEVRREQVFVRRSCEKWRLVERAEAEDELDTSVGLVPGTNVIKLFFSFSLECLSLMNIFNFCPVACIIKLL